MFYYLPFLSLMPFNNAEVIGKWKFNLLFAGTEYEFKAEKNYESKIYIGGELASHTGGSYEVHSSTEPRKLTYKLEKYIYPDDESLGDEIGDVFKCIFAIQGKFMKLNCTKNKDEFPLSFNDSNSINITLKRN